MGLFNNKKKDKIPGVSGGGHYTTTSSQTVGTAVTDGKGYPNYKKTYVMPQPQPSQNGPGPGYAQRGGSAAPTVNRVGRKPAPSLGGGGPSPGVGTGEASGPPPPPTTDDRLQMAIQRQREPGYYSGPAGSASGSGGTPGYGGAAKSQSNNSSRKEVNYDARPPDEGRPPSYKTNASVYGDASMEQQQQIEEEEEEGYNDSEDEIEGIKQQIRFAKQEGLASTRNAVRVGHETEETARAILDKLGEQSERLLNAERNVDMVQAHNSRAMDEAREIEALNRSILIPRFKRDTRAKRQQKEAEVLARHDRERLQQQLNNRDLYDSRQRVRGTFKDVDKDVEYDEHGNPIRRRLNGAVRAANPERLKYQFEATQSDDEIEDEIEDNLDEISGIANRLKTYALAAGKEVDVQNRRLERLDDKVDVVDFEVTKGIHRFARLK